MDQKEIMHYWYYFCSLCSQLNDTRQYVDHSTVDKSGITVLANGDTYSNEFLKILLSSSSEFETVGKLLCKSIDKDFKGKSNIVLISETILSKYPNIVKTRIATDYEDLVPLSEWKIVDNANKKVEGLGWWRAYTDIKHARYENFKSATLKNCIDALGSLLVFELYLSMDATGSVSNLSAYGCDYFSFEYGVEHFYVKGLQDLPDF